MVEENILYKIKITKTPEGPAPEQVRILWLGIELLAVRTPRNVEEVDFSTNQEFGNRRGFMVKTDSAIKKLGEVSIQAAKWFEENLPPNTEYLTFGSDEVEIVPNSYITKGDL